MKKRLLSLLLCLCMALTLLPAAAWAAGDNDIVAILTDPTGAPSKSPTQGELLDPNYLQNWVAETGQTSATLTFQQDAVVQLMSAGLSLALTSGDGGPYTLHRDPEDKRGGVLHVDYDSTATVTALTLDGSYEEPPESSEPPRFITVEGELTLGEGATVQNCQPKDDPSAAIGGKYLPPAAVSVDGGSLTLASGSRIVDNQAKTGGVVKDYYGTVSISGSVTVKGNEAVDCSESSFDELATAPRIPANLVVYKTQRKAAGAPIQVTGALTGGEGSIGLTMLYEERDPEPTTGKIVEGAGYTLQSTDLAAFFSDRPGYFLELNTGENAIYLDQYAITTQPTADSPTVVVTQTEGVAYQWYSASMVTEAVTDQNTTQGSYACSYSGGKWTAGEDDYSELGYFTMALNEGDVITVTVEDGIIPTDGSLCLMDYTTWKNDSKGFQPNQAVYTLTAPADGIYALIQPIGSYAPVISATVTHAKLGEAVTGQTTATLTAPAAGGYLCQVTWPDGTVLQSNMISVAAPPHVHAVSVGCETTGEGLVTFDKALTSVDGVLCIDGVEVPSEVIDMDGVDLTQYSLPSGHYYLPENVALADKTSLFIGGDTAANVDLCLNGHTLNLGGSHSHIRVGGSGRLRLCDCGQDGGVRGAYTSNDRLGAMVNVTGELELYGGTVENTATPGQGEQARTVALFFGTAALHGGQVIARHDDALQYDASAVEDGGLTLYDGVTLKGGTDSAEVWLSDVLSRGDDPLLTIAQPLTRPATPWRLASSKAQALTAGWARHMAGADFNGYFQNVTPGRLLEKSAQGELTLADYAVTTQPTPQAPTAGVNYAPEGIAYQWYAVTVATDDVTTGNAAAYGDGEFGCTQPAAFENGKWTASQGTDIHTPGYFTMALKKGDKVTLTLDRMPTQGQLGLNYFNFPNSVQLWYYFSGALEPDEGVSADGTVITYVIPKEGTYDLILDGLDPDQATPLIEATLTHVALGQAVSGQTARSLTAATAGTYLCRVTWPDGTVLDSDVTTYTPAPPTTGHRPGGGRPRPNQSVWPFTDVKTTDAYYESVKYVYEKGWLLGTSKTAFSPESELTRAMLAAVLYRQAGSPKVEGKLEFEDTKADQWYSDAVTWADRAQILRGYGNGHFGPEDPVSREMLNIAMGRLRGEDPTWVGDPALALPATRAEIAQALMEQDKK